MLGLVSYLPTEIVSWDTISPDVYISKRWLLGPRERESWVSSHQEALERFRYISVRQGKNLQ